MNLFKVVFFAALAGISLLGSALSADSADRGRNACRRGERIRIQDLKVASDVDELVE